MPNQSYQGKLSMFPYDPRFRPIAPPTAGIFDEPQMSVCFNVEWAAHIDGVLSRLLWTDAWLGEPETQQWAVSQVLKLIVSMIARNPCGEGDCMDCCDDLIERLEAIEAAVLAGPANTPTEIRERANEVEAAYEGFYEGIYDTWEDDILNVYPNLDYDASENDAIRDQALCFITRRFVDICCDWVITNIELKQANQQTVLSIVDLIGGAADLLARFFAESSFASMFQNIDTILELETAALTAWVTTVSVEQIGIFSDEGAREDVACAWYNELKGEDITLSRFLSSLYSISLTGNADAIRLKLGQAITPVDQPTEPTEERMFFIWSDLWNEAYQGVVEGVVPECDCDEPDPGTPTVVLITNFSFPIAPVYEWQGQTEEGWDIWDIPLSLAANAQVFCAPISNVGANWVCESVVPLTGYTPVSDLAFLFAGGTADFLPITTPPELSWCVIEGSSGDEGKIMRFTVHLA